MGYVTQFHAYVFILREAPGALHLPPGVPAVRVAPSELGEVRAAQVVAVRELQGPRLALVPGLGGGGGPPVIRAGTVVALMVCEGGCVRRPEGNGQRPTPGGGGGRTAPFFNYPTNGSNETAHVSHTGNFQTKRLYVRSFPEKRH